MSGKNFLPWQGGAVPHEADDSFLFGSDTLLASCGMVVAIDEIDFHDEHPESCDGCRALLP